MSDYYIEAAVLLPSITGQEVHVQVKAVDAKSLLQQLGALGVTLVDTPSVAPAKTETPKPSAKKPETLTSEQQAAVDDTAGLEDVNAKKPGAGIARTSPTARVEAAGVPAKMESASTQPAANAEAEPQASTAATDVVVTYAELQKAVLELHKLDPSATLPIAKAMGFENFKAMQKPGTSPAEEITAGVFARALAAVGEAIADRKQVAA